MKLKLCYLAILASTLLLQSCGGGGLANDQKDTDTMHPEAGVEDTSARPRPPENAAVITTDTHYIYDVSKNPVLLRGINLEYGNNPTTRIAGITAIKTSASNVVRLVIDENTTEIQLEAALSKALDAKLISIISFSDSTGKLAGSEDGNYLLGIVDTLWLKKWAPVIAQDRFQSNIMINIADGWGPNDIFNKDSLGYKTYIDTYKSLIRRFRDGGWKVPIVIGAPHSGQDFNAFLNGRSRELIAADSASNLILGVNIEGPKWNSSDEISNAATLLYNEKLPFVATGIAGSDLYDEGDAPVDHLEVLSKSAGDPALDLTLPWATASDEAAYKIDLSPTLDLRGGAILSTQVFIDKIYGEFEPNSSGNFVPKGKLSFALYVKDTNGNILRAGTTVAAELRSNQWSKLSFSLPASIAEIDPANLLNGATTFDLGTISSVGIQVLANGKAASLKAPIKFDDLSILPGAPQPTLAVESTFEGSAGGWERASWSPGVALFEDGYAKLSLGTGDWGIVVESPLYKSSEIVPKIDFKQTVFVDLKVFVPASYAGQTPSFAITGNFTDPNGEPYNWNIAPESSAIIKGELKYGAWNDYRATLKWGESNDVSSPQNIAFKLSGISPNPEPLLLDTVTITQQEAQRTKTVTSSQYKATFTKGTEGFVQLNWDSGKGVVSMEGGELLVTLPAGDGGSFSKEDISSISEVDLKGNVSVKMKIFIPADWAGQDFEIKPFFQSGAWQHFQYATIKVADLTPGAWKDLDLKLNFPASDFTRSLSPKRFGVQFFNVPGGVVKFDDIEIIGDTQVVDAQPIFTIGFSTQEEIDSVKFDFAAGSFSESGLAAAKSSEWRVIPFGWTATSWKGNTGDRAVLDISKAEDIVDLTVRGEEIVNGLFGIKNTSLPTTVSPLK